MLRNGSSHVIGAEGLKGLLRILPEKDEVSVFVIKSYCCFSLFLMVLHMYEYWNHTYDLKLFITFSLHAS